MKTIATNSMFRKHLKINSEKQINMLKRDKFNLKHVQLTIDVFNLIAWACSLAYRTFDVDVDSDVQFKWNVNVIILIDNFVI